MVHQRFGLNRVRAVVLISLCAGTALVLIGILTAAELRAQGETDVLHACSSQSGLRLVSDPNECRGNETIVEWNVQGPEGSQGPQGPPGSSQVSLHLADLPPVSETRAAYIKIGDIPGESRTSGYEGWSDLLSFDQQFQIPLAGASGSGRIGGSPVLDDIIVVKELDKASPLIAQRSLQGQIIPTIRIHLTDLDTDGNRHSYLEYELKDVIISSYQLGGSGQSDVVPTEEVSFNFAEIKVTYTELDENGKPGASVEYEHNVQTASS